MIRIIGGYIIALIFWFIMFSPWTARIFNFWAVMLIATGVLTTYSLIFGNSDIKILYKFNLKWIIIGLLSALILYLIFFTGNFFSKLLFNFAGNQIDNIYSTKSQSNNFFIGLALLFWIGPAEEIFWRGYAQHKLSKLIGNNKALILNSLIYAFVHIWAFNFMLFMAALICGFFWGFMFNKYKSVIPVIFSHAVWDLTIFIILPLS